jgi:hypothetical protein
LFWAGCRVRRAFRCEHRKRGGLGGALQDHWQISPSPSGGDRRSGRIDAKIMNILATPFRSYSQCGDGGAIDQQQAAALVEMMDVLEKRER